MGVYDAHGIECTHQNLKVKLTVILILCRRRVLASRLTSCPFEKLEWYCSIVNDVILPLQHDQCFSPCNAQIRCLPDQSYFSFFSCARYEHKCVVTFHVLPGTLWASAMNIDRLGEGGATISKRVEGLHQSGRSIARTGAIGEGLFSHCPDHYRC